VFGCWAPPGPTRGAYSAPLALARPLAGLKRGKERGERSEKEEGQERGGARKGRGRRKGEDPQCLKCIDAFTTTM